MNVTEAHAVNTLLRHVLNVDDGRDDADDPVEVADDAETAAAFLAGRARDRLGAGMSTDELHTRWEHLAIGPYRAPVFPC